MEFQNLFNVKQKFDINWGFYLTQCRELKIFGRSNKNMLLLIALNCKKKHSPWLTLLHRGAVAVIHLHRTDRQDCWNSDVGTQMILHTITKRSLVQEEVTLWTTKHAAYCYLSMYNSTSITNDFSKSDLIEGVMKHFSVFSLHHITVHNNLWLP